MYVDHRETCSLDDISFYSGWLARNSRWHILICLSVSHDSSMTCSLFPLTLHSLLLPLRCIDIWIPCLMIIFIIWYRMRHKVSQFLATRMLYTATSNGISRYHILIWYHMLQKIYLGQLITRYLRRNGLRQIMLLMCCLDVVVSWRMDRRVQTEDYFRMTLR